jgi:hypothetical protein
VISHVSPASEIVGAATSGSTSRTATPGPISPTGALSTDSATVASADCASEAAKRGVRAAATAAATFSATVFGAERAALAPAWAAAAAVVNRRLPGGASITPLITSSSGSQTRAV